MTLTRGTKAFVRVNYEAGDGEREREEGKEGFTNHKTYIFTAASPLKHTHPARNGGPADRYVYQVDQVSATRTRPKTLKQATAMTKEIQQLNRAIKESETRSKKADKEATGGRRHLRKKNNTLGWS